MTELRRISEDSGREMDATFSVIPEGRPGAFSVTWESQGGRAGGPNPRNLEYRLGLELALRRLASLGAVLDEVRVETGATMHLSPEEQRIVIPSITFPVHLAGLDDVVPLRKAISRYGRKVGQPPELASRAGGSSRRLRLVLSAVPLDAAGLADAVALGGRVSDEGDAKHVVDAMVRARSAGQGFLSTHELRRAVEMYAVEHVTRALERQGWTVEDVGATESYDLHCTWRGSTLHVEVKGTTGSGDAILLTANEVTHAREWHPDVALAIVRHIALEHSETGVTCSGGVLEIRQPWLLDERLLEPMAFTYNSGEPDSSPRTVEEL